MVVETNQFVDDQKEYCLTRKTLFSGSKYVYGTYNTEYEAQMYFDIVVHDIKTSILPRITYVCIILEDKVIKEFGHY